MVYLFLILLGPFLNTLSQILLTVSSFWKFSFSKRGRKNDSGNPTEVYLLEIKPETRNNPPAS